MTRTQRFWSRLAVELGRRAGLVALVGLLVTMVLGYGLTKLHFATGQDSYLNPEDQVAKDNLEYQGLFGGDAMLVLVTAEPGKTIYDLTSPQNIKEMQRVGDELSAHQDTFEAVLSPPVALQWTNNLIVGKDGDPAGAPVGKALLSAIERDPTAAGKKLRAEDTATSLARLSKIPPSARNFDNPEWTRFLIQGNDGKVRKSLRAIFPDDTHMQMPVRLVGNGSIEQGGEAADLATDVAGAMRIKGATVTVAGAPALLKHINDYLQKGMLLLGGIAVVIMMIILVVLFDVRWRLLPLGVILLGLTWAFGLAGYLGIPLSVVTIAGLPVMLGVGIDYAIQMHARLEEEVLVDRSHHPIQETARSLGPALLVVTFDAVFAFFALRFAKVPMVRDFGALLMIGITVICLCSIIVPMAALGIREYRSPTKPRAFKEGFLGRFVVKLGALPVGLAPILGVVSIAIFAGGLAVEEKLEIQSDPVEWVDPGAPSLINARRVMRETGSASELGIFVKSDRVFDQRTVNFVHDFTAAQLRAHPDDLLTATSLVTAVGYVLELPGAGDVAPRAEDVQAAYDVAPPELQRTMLRCNGGGTTCTSFGRGAMNIIFRYGEGSLEDRRIVLNEIKASTNPPPGVSATPSGLAVVGVGLLENIQSNRILLTYLSLGFVFVFLLVRLRSVVRAVLSLVPVLIAVGMASLVAWALHLKLSPMTAVGGPLVIADCTEFTSLMLFRFIEERQRGLGPRAAVDMVASRTGRAFIVSALTAVAGVIVIATATLPLLRDFGLVVGVNVAVALLSALVVLPPLLVWADNRGWVSKGMVSDDVLRATTPRYTGRPEELPVAAGAGPDGAPAETAHGTGTWIGATSQNPEGSTTVIARGGARGGPPER